MRLFCKYGRMLKVGSQQIDFCIVLVVALCEVLLHQTEIFFLSGVFTWVVYILILLAFLSNQKRGARLFLLITCLSLGVEMFQVAGSNEVTFRSLRLLGVSFNLVFTFLLTFLLLLKRGFKYPRLGVYTKILVAYIIYIMILGVLNICFGNVKLHSYVDSCMLFFPVFFYIPLVALFSKDEVVNMFKEMIVISSIAILFAFLTSKYFLYGASYFVVVSHFSLFFLPFFILLHKKEFPRFTWLFFLFLMSFLIFNEKYFFSGKSIFVFLFLLLWLLHDRMKGFWFLIPLLLIIILVFGQSWAKSLSDYMLDKNMIIASKFLQVHNVFKRIGDPQALFGTKESLSIVLAEGYTIFLYYLDKPFQFFFGQGAGATVPDAFGYLTINGVKGAFPIEFAKDDAFRRFHIPIYNFMLEGGFLSIIIYFYLLIRFFIIRNKYAFFAFISLIFFIYVNKENLLIYIMLLSTFDCPSTRLHLKK